MPPAYCILLIYTYINIKLINQLSTKKQNQTDTEYGVIFNTFNIVNAFNTQQKHSISTVGNTKLNKQIPNKRNRYTTLEEEIPKVNARRE